MVCINHMLYSVVVAIALTIFVEQRPSCQRCRHIGKTCVYGLRLTWLAEKVQSLLNMPSGVEWARNEHTRPASTGTAFLNTTWSDLHGHFNGEACNMRYSSNSNDSYSNREICYAIMGCEGSSSPSLLLSIPSQLASYSTHEYRIPKSLNGPRPNLSSADMAIFDFCKRYPAPKQIRLTNHSDVNKMCPHCRFADGYQKRYRQVIIPITLVSPLVLLSVLAVAANQLKYSGDGFGVTALRYQTATLRVLSHVIGSVNSATQSHLNVSMSKTEILSAIWMLCFFEFGNDNRCRSGLSPPAWRVHLEGARRILELPASAFGGLSSWSCDPGVVTFLAGFLASRSVLAYTTVVNPSDEEALYCGGSYWLSKIGRSPQEIENYTNCSNELLGIILETCHRIRWRNRARTTLPQHEDEEALRNWRRQTESRLLHIAQVPSRALSLEPCSPSSLLLSASPASQTTTTTATEYPPSLPTVYRIAEAFRHAALILLQYLNPNVLVEDNPAVRDSVRMILNLMSAAVPVPPRGKSGRSIFLWPFFIASCHVQTDEDRMLVLRKFQDLECAVASVSNDTVVPCLRDVVENVWKQQDLRKDCVRGKYRSFSREDWCFEWERAMRVLGYAIDWT